MKKQVGSNTGSAVKIIGTKKSTLVNQTYHCYAKPVALNLRKKSHIHWIHFYFKIYEQTLNMNSSPIDLRLILKFA